MKSTVMPFIAGMGIVLGFCYWKSNKSKVDNLIKEVRDCGNKIVKEFKVSSNCCCDSNNN